MPDYEKMYRLLAESVDGFFACLEQEDAYSAVELLARGRLCCLEWETEEKNESEIVSP